MTTEIGPGRKVVADARTQRRRAWGTGVGILGVIAAVVTSMVLSHSSGASTPPAPQPISTQAALGAQPTQPAPTAAPTTAAPTTAASVGTSAPPAATSWDVNGDGQPDSATTRFSNQRTAQVVVRLGDGKTLTSKAFSLYRQDGAGEVFGVRLGADHAFSLLVSDPGADGTGYHLFHDVAGSLREVPAPKGQQVPYLYIGGGMYYSSTFGCSNAGLVVAQEQPAVKTTATLPSDPPFRVTTTVYALAGGTLTVQHTATVRVANRAAAQKLLLETGNGCGTRP